MPASSVSPSFSEDSLHDVFADVVARWRGNIPAARAEFNQLIAAIAIEALKECAETGRFSELFPQAPMKARDKEAIARILAELIDSDQPRLLARCIDFVGGFGVQQGISQTEIAEIEGFSKAQVSKICVHLKEDLDLPPSRGMKSNAACKVYAERQTGKKRERSVWRFRGMLSHVTSALPA